MIIDFIEKSWPYLVAAGTVVAYLFEKGRDLWLDISKKKVAYNHVFTATIKVYLSYVKHSALYSEETPLNFPDSIYGEIVTHLDTFNDDVQDFIESVNKEADVIPEILIQVHLLFDTIDRINIVDRMNESISQLNTTMDKQQLLIAKRALFYALGDVFHNSFDDIIDNLKGKASIRSDFMERIEYYRTSGYKDDVYEEQKKIAKRYFESLQRQGVFPKEVLEQYYISMGLDENHPPPAPRF